MGASPFFIRAQGESAQATYDRLWQLTDQQRDDTGYSGTIADTTRFLLFPRDGSDLKALPLRTVTTLIDGPSEYGRNTAYQEAMQALEALMPQAVAELPEVQDQYARMGETCICFRHDGAWHFYGYGSEFD